jgi:hypothetical protein
VTTMPVYCYESYRQPRLKMQAEPYMRAHMLLCRVKETSSEAEICDLKVAVIGNEQIGRLYISMQNLVLGGKGGTI